MTISRWLGGGNGNVSSGFGSNTTTGIKFKVNKVTTVSEIGIKSAGSNTGLGLRVHRVSDSVLMMYTANNTNTVEGWNWVAPVPYANGGNTTTLQPNIDYMLSFYHQTAMQNVYATGSGAGETLTDTTSIPGTTITWINYRYYSSTDTIPVTSSGQSIPAVGFSTTTNAAPNAPNITAPAAEQNVNTRTPTIQWTFSDPDAGDTQSAFLVQTVNNAYNAVLWDSGWIAGAQTSYTLPAAAITADGPIYVRMQVKDAAGVINAANGTGPDAAFGNRHFIVDTVAPTIGSLDGIQYKNSGATVRVTAYNVADAAPSSGLSRVGVYWRYSADGGTTWGGWNGEYNATASGANYYYDFPTASGNGKYDVHFRAYDNANNLVGPVETFFVFDTLVPTTPSYTVGTKTSKTIPMSGFSAYSDPAPASGFQQRYVLVQDGPNTTRLQTNAVGNVSSYTITGLTPGTQYNIGVQDLDMAGNYSAVTWTLITTNATPTATIQNISSSGYLINQRPILQVTGTNYNSGGNNEYHIIISKNSNMSAPLADTWATHTTETGYAGWGTKATVASGAINVYTPQVDLGTGIVYVQVQAWDSVDGISGALTSFSFTINAPAWSTTLAAGDTTVSKRTIDDLRTKTNAVRQARGLSTITWAVATINAYSGNTPGTQISITHVNELRNAIQAIFTALGQGTIAWTDPTLAGFSGNTPGTPRKGTHWIEMRDKLLAS